MAGPIEQFAIKPIVKLGEIGGQPVAFTNSALFMVLTALGAAAFMFLSSKRGSVVPGRWQSSAEILYEFVSKTLRENAGEKGMTFFPLVFSLFLFILFANLIGMFPYAFTVTSHIIVTFALAMLVFLTVTIYGPVSQSVRLFAVMLAGHITLKVFAGFVIGLGSLGTLGILTAVLPLAMTVALTALELLMAIIQAYVFTMLTCMYLNDALHPSH